jgi:NAD(P)H dehydrogenase (quinone)
MTLGITGASGHLGQLTTDALLERVEPGDVVLVTRNPSKLSDAAARGARVRQGDFSEPSTLDEAFAGIDRLLLISTEVIRERVPGHLAAIEAARRAGVRHVLYTSIINPVPENPAVVAADHRATEEGLRDSGLEWTFLRNSIYAEYQVPSASQAIASGRHVHNSGDEAVSYVSRVDCAAAAAGALAGAAQPGRAYDVTGPEAITAADLATLGSELSGRSIEVVALEDDAYIAGLVEHAHMPEAAARDIASFGASARKGFGATVGDGVVELSGRLPRSFRDVLTEHVDELVPARA